MKVVSMSGSLREGVGKKDAKRLRREGMVPCVIYGGEKQLCFHASEISFKDLVYTPEVCLVRLELDGKQYDAMLQDIQYHPVNERILHADFLQIFPDKPVKIAVPIKLTGNSPGVIKGGKLQIKLRKLLIQALPADLPDNIEVSISKLNIGDSIKVGQLSGEKLSFLDPEVSVVVMVKSARAAMMAGGDDDEEEGEEGGETTEGESETPAAE